MASIDKTYLKYSDYLILKEWCENTKLIYDNNVEGSPKDFLRLYTEPYDGEAPVWNTPYSFDRWLYQNCPLDFIQKRLSEQYKDLSYLTKELPKLETGSHYTIVSKPKINFRYKYNWWIDICPDSGYWFYGDETHAWYTSYSLLPSEMMSSHAHIRNLTKRKLNRLIKKWKLPIGTILRINNRWVGSDYSIKIKK